MSFQESGKAIIAQLSNDLGAIVCDASLSKEQKQKRIKEAAIRYGTELIAEYEKALPSWGTP